MRKILFIAGLCALLACEKDDIDDLKKDVKELSEQVDKNTEEIASLQTQFSTVITQIDEINAKLYKTDKDIADLQNSHKELKSVCDQLMNQIEKLNEGIVANQKEIEELSKNFEANKERIEELKKLIDANQEEIAKLNQFMADNEIIHLPATLQQIKDSGAAVVFGDVYINTPEQCDLLSDVKHIVGTLRVKYDFDGKLVLPRIQTVFGFRYQNSSGQTEQISEVIMPELQNLLDWNISYERYNIFKKVLMPKLIGHEDLDLDIYVSEEIDLSSLMYGGLGLTVSDENTKVTLSKDLSGLYLDLTNADLFEALNNVDKLYSLDVFDCITSQPTTVKDIEFLRVHGGKNGNLTVETAKLEQLIIKVDGEPFKMCQLKTDIVDLLKLDVYRSDLDEYVGKDQIIDLPELDNVKTILDTDLIFHAGGLSFKALNGNYERFRQINIKVNSGSSIDLDVFNGVQTIKKVEDASASIYIYDRNFDNYHIFSELISSEVEIEIESYFKSKPDLCCMKKYLEQDNVTAPFKSNYWTREELLATCSVD
jgi:prefoldin subunit 5